jgi:hypothetical protein
MPFIEQRYWVKSSRARLMLRHLLSRAHGVRMRAGAPIQCWLAGTPFFQERVRAEMECLSLGRA